MYVCIYYGTCIWIHPHPPTHTHTHTQVFIGGTADKDEAELRAHFAKAFGAVADVEVVRERDGSHRGFAFVTFQVFVCVCG